MVCLSVGPSVEVIRLRSAKTRLSAPAYPSAAGISRVSGLVLRNVIKLNIVSFQPNYTVDLV